MRVEKLPVFQPYPSMQICGLFSNSAGDSSLAESESEVGLMQRNISGTESLDQQQKKPNLFSILDKITRRQVAQNVPATYFASKNCPLRTFLFFFLKFLKKFYSDEKDRL